MGFLSDMWEQVDGPDEVQEAIIDAVCVSVAFDDEISDAEEEYVVGFIMEFMQIDDEEEALDYFRDGLNRIQDQVFEDIVDDIAERLPEVEQREIAFLAAVGASRSDSGIFSWGEEELLDAMADAFDFSDEERDQIIDYTEQMIDDFQR